ncbi:MAG: hypothetical protein GY696_07925 [Gammaproteobacteria bacterium]|nr:hypothetical protein [Gammaproteobacteria bacterium]
MGRTESYEHRIRLKEGTIPVCAPLRVVGQVPIVTSGPVRDRTPYLSAEGVEVTREKKEVIRAKAERRNRSQKTSPFHVGDIVQHKLPRSEYRKGQSPKSRPMRIISQMGRWDFRLADGKTWNARSLSRYHPAHMIQGVKKTKEASSQTN